MSTVATPFAIDIEKVKSVFGCKDRELLEKIKTTNFYSHYENQDDFSGTEYLYDFDQALEDIIFNYIKPEDRKVNSSFFGLVKSKTTSGLNEKIGYGYGYVLLVICDYFGNNLLAECDSFYYGRDFEEAFEIMKSKGLQLDLREIFETHDVFDIPKIADFPAITHFTKHNIEHINSILDNIEIVETKTNIEDDDFDEVQYLLKNIIYCFKTCEENDLELITFAH